MGMTMKYLVGAAVLVFTLTRAASGTTQLAVTIDDLPAHGPLPPDMTRLAVAQRLITVLTRHAVPDVVGFLNGGPIREDPERAEIVKQWLQAGFRIGNHTFSHLEINRVTAAEYIADIERNEAVLNELVGGRWTRLFRYPYLHQGERQGRREAVRQWLATHGYRIAPVTVTFDDWAWNDAYARCAQRHDDRAITWLKRSFLDAALRRLAWSRAASEVTFGRPIRQILLLHLGAFDAVMLEDLLAAYRKAGVRMIGLDTALADPVYQLGTDRSWHGESSFLFEVAWARGVRIPTAPEIPFESLRTVCP
jgi:peptidoglycan-N-acetylglucosamine deacetylase